jgi:nucleosome binding factor SPN SPT16 subunit
VEGEQLQLQENKIAAIQSFASSKGFVVQKEDIFVYTMSGFLTEGETVDKMARLLMDTSEVASIEPDFFMQNARARMQGGSAFPQNSRPRMQEEPKWGYDVVNYTSKIIPYLGGGFPIPV